MKVQFISAGPIEWGSSRMRCYWPSRYMEDASVITIQDFIKRSRETETAPRADVYIWQKHAFPEWMEQLPGRHWYDTCDPMHWFSPDAARKIDRSVEGVVASNPKLAEDYTAWAGRQCHVISDRLELEHFNLQREHVDTQRVRIIWYGVAVNRISLAAAWANLSRLRANGYNITLTILDNYPQAPLNFGNEIPLEYARWSLEDEVPTIAAHDIALLPPYPGPWGLLKSNNKELAAKACGLPVTDGQDYFELVALIEDHQLRQRLGDQGRKDVETFWTVDRSAKQWERLLCS